MGLGTVFAYLAGLVLIYILGLFLVIPIKILTRLLINGIIGGIVLFIFNLIGGMFGTTIAINPLNALVVGFLGVPGVILLLIVQLVL